MLSDPANFLYLSVFAALSFWALPSESVSARRWVLIGFSVIFIYALSPPSLLLCAAVSLIAFAAGRAIQRFSSPWVPAAAVAAMIATLVFAELFFPPLTYYREYQTIDLAVTMGLSYAVLKSIALVVDSYQQRKRLPPASLSHVLLLNFYFPIYAAGPIERARTFSDDAIATRFDPLSVVEGVVRVVIGLFKIGFIADVLLAPILNDLAGAAYDADSDLPMIDYYMYIWLVFVNLYFNFSGYTDVAIGTGRLFNLKIMENFRFPFLARNIQEFWQRWHLSLGQFFVMTYMFYPLARATGGRVNLSIFVSFAVIGLWHELTWHYFIWGVLQGIGLIVPTYYGRMMDGKARTKALRNNWVHVIVGWAITMTYISWTVGIAVSGGVAQSMTLTAHLLGF